MMKDNKFTVLLLLLLFSFVIQAQEKRIVYTKELDSFIFEISIGANNNSWKPIKMAGIDIAFNDEENGLQIIFGTNKLKNKLKNQFEYIQYFIKTFNKEYNINTALISFSPSSNIIKCYYSDEKSNFLLYTFYHNEYYIFAMIYGIGNETEKSIDCNIEKDFDNVFFKSTLKINEKK